MSWNPDEYGGDIEAVLNEVEQEESNFQEDLQNSEEVLSIAMQRIEEANLFKMLIKGNIFAEGSADPMILNSVNQKIRNFATQELERLLGINQTEKPKEVEVKMPFDEEELLALRTLASKILKRDRPAEPVVIERKPELNQIALAQKQTKDPKMKEFKGPSAQRVAQPAQQKKLTTQPKPPTSSNKKAKRSGGGAGYAVPSKKMAMPDASALVGIYGATAPGISTANSTDASSVAGLVSALTNQLTNGNVLSTHDSNEITDSEDINGRF